MTAISRALGGSNPFTNVEGLGWNVAIGAFTILLGVGVAAGAWYVSAALALTMVAFVVGLLNWRWSMLALLAYIPVSGIAIVATYPSGAAALIKDILFVLPAYAGFFGTYAARRQRITFDRAPIAVLGMLAILVLLGTLNPHLPSFLVGLVGVRSWIFYIPIMFIAYHMIRNVKDLEGLFRLMCLVAIIPAAIGIFEAILIYGGQAGLVYSWYGPAASAATQGFAALDVGGSSLHRVPSTFSFVAQYYVFASAMVAVAYAWWQMGTPATRPWRAALWALMLVAALTSGARGAFVFVPILLLLIMLIDGRLGARTVGMAIAGFGGIMFMLSLVGTDIGSLMAHLKENATTQWHTVVVNGAEAASDHLVAGLGTGADTNAARHVVDRSLIGSEGGVWQESWWVKSALELGLAGLILSVALYGSIIGAGLRQHRQLRRPEMRSVSAAILAVLIWTAIYNFKGSYTDLDPLNVYFWLLAGILYKLGALDRQSWSDPESEPEPRERERRIDRPRPPRRPIPQPRPRHREPEPVPAGPWVLTEQRPQPGSRTA